MFALLGLLPQLSAQSQVNYSGALNQRTVHNADGSAVANGNQVWIGSFDAGFNVAANADDPVALFGAWNPFGQTTISTIIGQPGHFTGNSSSTDPLFNNQKIYLWIFSTDAATAPNTGDWNNLNEYGLYSANLANWTFAPVTAPPPSNLRNINSNEVNENPFGSRDATHLFLSNGFTIVPEPTTLGLLSIGIPAVVLALRKRRTSR